MRGSCGRAVSELQSLAQNMIEASAVEAREADMVMQKLEEEEQAHRELVSSYTLSVAPHHLAACRADIPAPRQ